MSVPPSRKGSKPEVVAGPVPLPDPWNKAVLSMGAEAIHAAKHVIESIQDAANLLKAGAYPHDMIDMAALLNSKEIVDQLNKRIPYQDNPLGYGLGSAAIMVHKKNLVKCLGACHGMCQRVIQKLETASMDHKRADTVTRGSSGGYEFIHIY
eukprot:Platyproteum_vivax@DN12440_c0_g1_i1.p1